MMQDAWRDNWQPLNVFLSSRPATSSLGVLLAINPLENRWPIKSYVQGEPPLINADSQGASLTYFCFKESESLFWGFDIVWWKRAVTDRDRWKNCEKERDVSFWSWRLLLAGPQQLLRKNFKELLRLCLKVSHKSVSAYLFHSWFAFHMVHIPFEALLATLCSISGLLYVAFVL